MKKPHIIVYLYNQFQDPVIQSNIFLYIKSLASDPKTPYHFAIVSFETNETLTQKEKIEKIKSELGALNIDWYPKRWHPGTSLHLKLLDILSGFYQVMLLRFRGYRYILSLASVAGSHAYLFSLILRFRLYLYQYEPHSEYEVDCGTYTRESLTFKTLNALEKLSAEFATVISSGTRHMMDRLTTWGVKAKRFTIPSVVNDEKFSYSEKDRTEIRNRYKVGSEKTVIYYPGKFGGLYYKEETIEMFSVLLNADTNFHALVVTPNNVEDVKEMFYKYKIPDEQFTVTQASFDVIQKYHSAADFAIIAAPPGPSKKFVSNIKVGEYLCSGLPYLISRGISEDDEYAIRYNVGVVVENFSPSEIRQAYPKIKTILSGPAAERREHCRRVGIEYRGFQKLNKIFRSALEALTA